MGRTPADDAASINRQSVAVQVAAVLRDRIVSGELAPGSALKETPLATNFGVSRNTIREALGLLASDGIAVQSPFKGVTVAVIDRDDIHDIFQLRHIVEPLAIDATKDADPSLFGRLRACIDVLRGLPADADWRDIVAADLQFHRELIGAIGNTRINRTFDNAITELRLIIFIANTEDRESPQSLADQHGELLDLMESGDRAACKKRLESHLADGERLLLDYVARHSAPEPA